MHHARASKSQWQSRRNMSLGPPVRRAHPASGATWNVQVVRGKMTSRCLWHACRALILGVVLMFLGAGMATIGYYAEHLSVGQEIRGNATVRVKNESRGFHLNNLSYVGPIVMGFGGFIVVAACVMTFEARDSAAKVVPARFKVSTTSRTPRTNSSSRRTTGTSTQTGPQVTRGGSDNHVGGVFRTLPASTATAAAALTGENGTLTDRKALTAALVHFSRALGKPRSPNSTANDQTTTSDTAGRRVSRSDSVPNLQQSTATSDSQRAPLKHQSTMTSMSPMHSSARYPRASTSGGRHRCHRKNTALLQRSSLSGEKTASPIFLHPSSSGAGNRSHHHWHQYRHAMSVDETGPYYRSGGGEQSADVDSRGTTAMMSSASTMTTSATSRRREHHHRSDTARRHVLSRQKPIEKDEPHQHADKTSSRTTLKTTEPTNVFRRSTPRAACGIMLAPHVSRTFSVDSRAVQTELTLGESSRAGRTDHVTFRRSESARRLGHREWSTPSEERESRSEFSSVKSEPLSVAAAAALRSISTQSSSLEPCVPEESGAEDTTTATTPTSPILAPDAVAKRPNSLILKCSAGADTRTPMHGGSDVSVDPSKPVECVSGTTATSIKQKQKFLYRSSSSRLYNRPSRSKVQLSTKEIDQIYFIGSNKEDEYYDSIDVIDERRNSNFKRSVSSCGAPLISATGSSVPNAATASFCRSSSVIYSEYCSDIGGIDDSTERTQTTTTTAKTLGPATMQETTTTATTVPIAAAEAMPVTNATTVEVVAIVESGAADFHTATASAAPAASNAAAIDVVVNEMEQTHSTEQITVVNEVAVTRPSHQIVPLETSANTGASSQRRQYAPDMRSMDEIEVLHDDDETDDGRVDVHNRRYNNISDSKNITDECSGGDGGRHQVLAAQSTVLSSPSATAAAASATLHIVEATTEGSGDIDSAVNPVAAADVCPGERSPINEDAQRRCALERGAVATPSMSTTITVRAEIEAYSERSGEEE